MRYEINGKVVETDKELSEAEIDEIAAQLGGSSEPPSQSSPTPSEPKFYELEKQPGLPKTPMDRFKQVVGQFAEGALSPMPGSILTTPIRAMQQTAQQAGSDVARGTQDKLGAIPARLLGFGTSVALDPTTYMSGAAAFGKAVVPAERQLAVKAAQQFNVPLTRAEMTGGRAAGGIESALEKTLTGSDVIDNFRQTGNQAVESMKNMFKQQFGTPLQPSQVGKAATQGIDKTVQTLKSSAQEIYETLPVVKTRPAELRLSSEELLREQYALPRTNRDGSLIRMLHEYRKLGTKVVKEVDDALQRTVYKRVENPKAYPTSKALQRMASDLGEAYRKSFKVGEKMGNVGSRDSSILSSAIQRDLQAVGELKTQLDTANHMWRQAKNIDKNPLIKRLRMAGPEEATQLIFNGRKVSNVKMAKLALGDQGYKTVKSAYFNQLIDSPNLSKELNKMSAEYITSVFSSVEIETLRKAAALQTIRGAAEKMGGQAGSARSNMLSLNSGAIGAGLYAAGASLMHGNIPGVIGGLAAAGTAYKGPQLAANAYLKYGTKGVSVPMAAPGAGQVASRCQDSTLSKIRSYLQNQGR